MATAFLRRCNEATKGNLDVVLILDPEVLGDSYEKIVGSLRRLDDAKMSISIVPRIERER